MSKSVEKRVEVLEAAMGGLGIDLRMYDYEAIAEARAEAEREAAAAEEAARKERAKADAEAVARAEVAAAHEEKVAARADEIHEERESGKAKARKR